MGRINNDSLYQRDKPTNPLDKVIGSDFDSNYSTKNFYLRDIKNFSLDGTIASDNMFLSIGDLQLIGQILTIFSGWVWRINGDIYTNEGDISMNIPYASTGNKRIYLVSATTTEQEFILTSSDDSLNPVRPTPELNTLAAVYITVSDSEVLDIDISHLGVGYIEKQEKKEIEITSTGDIDIELNDVKAVVKLSGTINSVRSISLVGSSFPYTNKKFVFKNNQNTFINLKHLSLDGDGDIKFSFPNEVDYELQPKEIAEFYYNQNDKILEFVGLISSGGSSNIVQTITNGDTTHAPSADVVYDKLLLKQNLPTGFVSGLTLSIDPMDNTKAIIDTGGYIITDFSDLFNIQAVPVQVTSPITFTPEYLGTSPSTYVALDINMNVVSSATPFDNEDRRNLCLIGNVVHSNNININVVNEIKAPIVAPTNQLHDLIKAVGFLNLEGNQFSPNGSNLSLNKTAGKIWGLGINGGNYLDPHRLTLGALTQVTLRYRLSNSVEFSDSLVLDPTQYESSTGVLTPLSNNNRWSVQHLNMFQSGAIRIQYGQHEYNSFQAARNASFTESFTTEQNIADNAIFRCLIIMQKTCTDLQASIAAGEAEIIHIGKFGNAIGGSTAALTLANIIAVLGYTPENVANKQNDLTVDGTGIKYPTVDAINQALTPQITITTSVSIDTNTTSGGLSQKGRNVVISNGVNAINYTVNASDGFIASFLKHGTAAITFVQGGGRTLIQVDGTAVLNGTVGSTATISSVGTTDYLRISNA